MASARERYRRPRHCPASGTLNTPFGLGLTSECSCALSLVPTQSRLRAIDPFRQVRDWPVKGRARFDHPARAQNCGLVGGNGRPCHIAVGGASSTRPSTTSCHLDPRHRFGTGCECYKNGPLFFGLYSHCSPHHHLPLHKHLAHQSTTQLSDVSFEYLH